LSQPEGFFSILLLRGLFAQCQSNSTAKRFFFCGRSNQVILPPFWTDGPAWSEKELISVAQIGFSPRHTQVEWHVMHI
jgi:hypothetical protein